MLFRFQWHIDKLALGVRLGPRFISTSPLNNTKRICNQILQKCLAKSPLEKETRQKFLRRFCDHYISISEIEKQTK